MGKSQLKSTYPHGFRDGNINRGMHIQNPPGKVFYVGNNATLMVGEKGLSDGNDGSFYAPFATLDYAIGQCAAGRGDIIFIRPSHTESPTSSITVDIACLTICGLGSGTDVPTYASIATDAVIDVTAANVIISNLRFTALASGTQGGTQKIKVDATNCTLDTIGFFGGASDDDLLYITTNADWCRVYNCEFYCLNNGPDTAIYLEGADGGDTLTNVMIEDCWFNGGSLTNTWDLGIIYSSGIHTHCKIENNRFLYMSPGGIEFTAAATGIINGNFFGEGHLGEMLDPGSCFCGINWEQDAIDKKAREFPTTAAS